jgi:hypothetical protein
MGIRGTTVRELYCNRDFLCRELQRVSVEVNINFCPMSNTNELFCSDQEMINIHSQCHNYVLIVLFL